MQDFLLVSLLNFAQVLSFMSLYLEFSMMRKSMWSKIRYMSDILGTSSRGLLRVQHAVDMSNIFRAERWQLVLDKAEVGSPCLGIRKRIEDEGKMLLIR